MHFLLVLLLSASVFAETKRLTVEEAVAKVNQPPVAVQEFIARKTNSANFKNSQNERQNRSRIVGGTVAAIWDYPYQVALLFRSYQICGGSIIARSWALTAAHCLSWYPSNYDITIRSGSSSRSRGGIVHSINYYRIHELYDPDVLSHDVATVRVKLPFIGFSQAIIPLASSEWVEGADVIVTGWGLNAVGETVDKLLKVALPVVNRADCIGLWGESVKDDMLCAGKENNNPCKGDSGGPAVQGDVQYGIVSWGSYYCGGGLPSVYTYVAHPSIRKFIRDTAGV
ncbi:trypsin epsilon-like [Malaya genurostris]|uniref:trypsin epsilon-like n=1 Tax=Malaya genurostris TaxID=325434 RepID=UPI0026F3D5AB|nr:trypsin epsilon-like [Malaya genurostris]